MIIKIVGLDHLVLTVKSIEKTCQFYEESLGLERKEFGEQRIALHFGNQKINLHQVDNPIDKNVLLATPGSADICLIFENPIEEILNHLKSQNIQIIEGPCKRTGAKGPINSVYIYDPDKNLVELSTYSL